MNISFNNLSLIIGSVVGVLGILTIKSPLHSLILGIVAAMLTEGVLRIQNEK